MLNHLPLFGSIVSLLLLLLGLWRRSDEVKRIACGDPQEMRRGHSMRTRIRFLAVAIALALGTTNARAHCDSLDGPVVQAAEKALATGDVNLALIWVQKANEPEIREAFAHAEAVRKLGADARELADRHFFETLVRVHRAGEGAGFTGLKPAGRDLGPAIPAADKALENGLIEPLIKLLNDSTSQGVRDRFNDVAARKNFERSNVAAGREYVEAYVRFVHYVEALYQASQNAPKGHFAEADSHAVEK